MRQLCIFFLALFLFSACDNEENSLPVNQELTLEFGETKPIANVSWQVKFHELKEDSRCPIYALCISAGQAVVELQFISGDVTRVLELTERIGHEELAMGEIEGFNVTLISVTPYSGLFNEEVTKEDYSIVLKIE